MSDKLTSAEAIVLIDRRTAVLSDGTAKMVRDILRRVDDGRCVWAADPNGFGGKDPHGGVHSSIYGDWRRFCSYCGRRVEAKETAVLAKSSQPQHPKCAECGGKGQVPRSYGWIPCDACNGEEREG